MLRSSAASVVHNIPENLIFGGPKWVDEERYDIEAKAAGPAGTNDMMTMLQSLLAERFHLVVHREQRQMSGYALVVAKNGLKAKPSGKETAPSTDARRGSIDARASTLANLAQKLSEALHVPVADFTESPGRFDFKLSWNPEEAKPLTSSEASSVSIFTALQEQLGLKLESRKMSVEALVIDAAGKPTEN